MFKQILIGLVVLVSILNLVHCVEEAIIKTHYKPIPCSKNRGEKCLSSKDCCDNLICSYESYTCQCPINYKWSSFFDVCYQCPEGWSFYKDNCYFISAEEALATWNGAQEECTKIGGKLATFNTEVVVDKLGGLFEFFNLNGTFYIGAKSYFVPGNWSWLGSTFLPAAGPWWGSCNQALNKDGTKKFLVNGCAETDGSFLSDVLCDANSKRYICELKSNTNVLLPKKPGSINIKRCLSNQIWSNKLKTCVTCPKDWLLLDDGCFYVSNTGKTWNDANLDCKIRNATLFFSKSTFIIDVLASIFRINKLDSDFFWVGARSDDNNVISWVNGREIPNEGSMWATCGTADPDPAKQCVAGFGFGLDKKTCTSYLRYICRHN